MQIMPMIRTVGVAVSLAATIAIAPAFAQSQAQQPPQPTPTQQAQPNVYSGAADAAAKRSPDSDCKSPNGSLGAKSPEELAKAVEASKTPTYSGSSDDAAKNAMATCN